jgi:hypothetical protein
MRVLGATQLVQPTSEGRLGHASKRDRDDPAPVRFPTAYPSSSTSRDRYLKLQEPVSASDLVISYSRLSYQPTVSVCPAPKTNIKISF